MFGTKAGREFIGKVRTSYLHILWSLTISWQIVNMSKIVWAFNLKAGKGEADASVDTGYFGGFLIAPKEFPLLITPRSIEHVTVLKKEAAEAGKYLSQYKD